MEKTGVEVQIEEDIRQAGMVLVGIGQEFAYLPDGETARDIPEPLSWNSQGDIPEPLPWNSREAEYQKGRRKRAYQKLAELLQGRNYFIVTLCMDDLIYDSSLDAGRIVAPCGGRRFLQCTDGCSDALTTVSSLSDGQKRDLQAGKFPVCTLCGARLCFNNIGAPAYIEAGYLPQWEKYRKWLTGTVNRSLCILELGVGMEFPSIIRWPFEKVAYLNEKAKFYRIHSHLYQLTEEIKSRASAAAEDPVTFLLGDRK